MTLQELVRERNGRLRTDAIMKGVTGAVFTLALAAPIMVFTWFGCAYLFGFEHVTRNALVVTALVVAATFVDALRVPNPYAGLEPLANSEEKRRAAEDFARALVTGVAAAAGAGLVTVARADDRARAGCIVVGTAGPANVIDAVRLLRKTVPDDPHVLGLAREVLSRAVGRGVDPGSLEPADAYLVLFELGLLRAKNGRLVPSTLGETVLAPRCTALTRRVGAEHDELAVRGRCSWQGCCHSGRFPHRERHGLVLSLATMSKDGDERA